jgi:hypothetical protein
MIQQKILNLDIKTDLEFNRNMIFRDLNIINLIRWAIKVFKDGKKLLLL